MVWNLQVTIHPHSAKVSELGAKDSLFCLRSKDFEPLHQGNVRATFSGRDVVSIFLSAPCIDGDFFETTQTGSLNMEYL
jgi:hypothetical protein